MADVTINYKGSKIAELSAPGTKTLKTSGTYCEGDVAVTYAPNRRIYEVTLEKASGWVLLTTLDDDVLAHINDNRLTVSLVKTVDTFVKYEVASCFQSNAPCGLQGTYPIYGMSLVQSSETAAQLRPCYYPPNKTDTSTSLGGGAQFRLSGKQYYFRPESYYTGTGTYRLTFTW